MTPELTTHEDWTSLLALAETGDHIAQFDVAYYYDYGLIVTNTEIVKENGQMAFEWYNKAYKNGNIEALNRLADFLSEGIYCKQNLELAIELYQQGIDNGFGIAANNLAIIYRDKQDYKKAFELYKISLDLGGSNSLALALCYYYGIGTEKNTGISFEILLNISNDIPAFNNSQYEIDEANYLLSKIYLDGEIVEKSITKARTFLNLANTDDDHRSAQDLLLLIGKNK